MNCLRGKSDRGVKLSVLLPRFIKLNGAGERARRPRAEAFYELAESPP